MYLSHTEEKIIEEAYGASVSGVKKIIKEVIQQTVPVVESMLVLSDMHFDRIILTFSYKKIGLLASS